jgi:hypothetical protein
LEPEVHIIEKYFQEVLHCFTMTNIKCKGGKEIDLLAIHPKTQKRFHVEAKVSISKGFALREIDTCTSKGRALKRGLDYFCKEKFEHPYVKEKINEIFGDSNCYKKILCIGEWELNQPMVLATAYEKYGILVINILGLIQDLIELKATKGSRDDILRTLEFISHKDDAVTWQQSDMKRLLGV